MRNLTEEIVEGSGEGRREKKKETYGEREERKMNGSSVLQVL